MRTWWIQNYYHKSVEKINLKFIVFYCLFSQEPHNEGHLWEETVGLFWYIPAGGRAPVKQYGEHLVMLIECGGVLSGIQNEMHVKHRWVVAILDGFQMRQIRTQKVPPTVHTCDICQRLEANCGVGRVVKDSTETKFSICCWSHPCNCFIFSLL